MSQKKIKRTENNTQQDTDIEDRIFSAEEEKDTKVPVNMPSNIEEKLYKAETPGKVKRSIAFIGDVFKKTHKEPTVKSKDIGILADHADKLANIMKSARTKNEIFQLARLMKIQAKEIERIARGI